ncbi:DUF1254 domain-containing protein [Nodosilinea sp. E11]|uniref:DUF1254 domain-containing protein n=1 Tax=Nodosilinea sp. E11 TaxID=3037479 RepID=UPI0029346422|nr:DUF1254 domain-containing protein [Nodosilinea sp. E11]WOD37025.1 DUF1254 domain-containing protein [Nodosilinea sp. E11]
MSASQTTAQVTATEAYEIGRDAYIYSFPLVVMELTRRLATSVLSPQPNAYAPINQLGYFEVFPDASFKDVVRPNNDTLYGSAWLDLSQEPIVLEVPDMGDRYYLLNVLNMWTDVMADPSPRTTTLGAKTYLIVGTGWSGDIPQGMETIKSTTNIAWFLSRIKVDSAEDVQNVRDLYQQFHLIPLSAYGRFYPPPQGVPPNPDWDISTPPLFQIREMNGRTFFPLIAELLKSNPPYPADAPLVARMAQIGLIPGQSFDWDALNPTIQQELERAVQDGLAVITSTSPEGDIRNGWTINVETGLGSPGNFGTNYLNRAYIALVGLGANLREDAVYPMTSTDAENRPLTGAYRYRMHFLPGQLPPVSAFWSLTMYDQDGFFVDNPLDRYVLGDRSNLATNPDGSIDLLIQHEAPAEDQQLNWLPAPSGDFLLQMRLYWPGAEVLQGNWAPPPIERLESSSSS